MHLVCIYGAFSVHLGCIRGPRVHLGCVLGAFRVRLGCV